MFKPFVINFRHWQDLMSCDDENKLYSHFWFFEVMNRLNPKIYNRIKD